MDFANRGNRPTQTPQSNEGQQNNSQPSQSFQPPSSGQKDKKGSDGSKLSKLGPVIMVFAITILLVALIIGLIFGGGSNADEADQIQTDKYQAVFLDSPDGQVYFGKLDVYNSDLYVLTDIFYVRVEQPIQPEGANQVQQPNISLAKLGNELHGPQDVMYISRSKVLYWENLKDDGQVVTAIKEFDASGRQTDQPQQQTQQPTDAGATQPTGTEEVNDTPTTPTDTPTETPTETPTTP